MFANCARNLRATARKSQNVVAAVNGKNNYSTDSVTFETKPYRLHKLDNGPASTVTLDKKDGLEYYKQMHNIRRLETAAGNLYKEQIVRGFCHLYSGQEAVAVGIKAAMRSQDAVITAYRAHGWSYLMGVPNVSVLCELAGKQGGVVRGKGGSMHMYAKNFYGGNGIVGAQVPLGAGVAFALDYLGLKGVCFALYGDGAANQGQVFEAYNMAKLWNLPIVFVCENNGYGMGTSADRASASTAYYTRGDYIPGIFVDGMDVLTVREAARFAVDYCTSGKGPLVMETATYRYSGHSMSDPGTSYRTREEVQEVRQTKDPITSFKEKILSTNLVTSEEVKKIEAAIRADIDESVKKSKSDKEVGLDELAADVYSLNLEPYARGIAFYQNVPHKNIGPAINKN